MSLPFLVLTTGLTVGLVIIVAFWLWSIVRYRSLRASFPAVDLPVLPIIGQCYFLKGNANESTKTFLKIVTSKPIILWLGPTPLLIVTQPEDMACILNSPNALNRPTFTDSLFGPLLEGGLILAKVDKWHLHRKILSPAFSTRILADFIPKMNENLNKLSEALDQVHGTINIRKYFLDATFKINSYMFLGVDFNADDCKFDLSSSVTAANTCLKITEERYKRLWLYPYFIYKMTSLYTTFNKHMDRLEHLRDKLLGRKIASKPNSEVSQHDFLGLLLDATERHPKFTVEEARKQLVTLIIGGYDTTATTASFGCLALAHNPDIQTKLYHELEQFLPDPEQEITVEILDKLTYLDMVTKETLRYFPIVPISGRYTTGPVVLSDGRIIPVGTTIMLPFILTHRDENHWPNAYVFDPERFLPENCQKRHAFAFLPFSGGKRKCIGYRLGLLMTKLLLAKTIRKYHVTTDLTWDEVTDFVFGLTMNIATDFRVELTLRN